MFCNVRWFAVAAVVAVMTLAAASVEAQVKPFKITGGGVGEEGLPLPGQAPRMHWAVGNATHLGRYSGEGTVKTDTGEFNPETGKIEGLFGSGSPFVFEAANGDQLVTVYGRPQFGAEETGTFELTILDVSPEGVLTVTAAFVAEFVVQPELSTGKFAGVKGSWIMFAFSEPFRLGTDDPVVYTWEGEGELTFPKKAQPKKKKK